MKTIFKPIAKLCFCFFATLMLILIATDLHAQRANFSGVWVLNEEKSVHEGLSKANLFDKKLISQNEKCMITETIIGDRKISSTLNLDGSPVESKMERPERKRVSTIKWLNDRSFETTATDDTGKEVFKSVSVTTLMADGKTMVIDATVDYKPNNTVYKYHLILDKQI